MNISDLTAISDSNRLADVENRAQGFENRGDFEGSVTGRWVGLGPRAEGIVNYKGKDYKTKPLGFVSIPQGTQVKLTYARGVYYSSY